MRKKGALGFTVFELVVVMAIIGFIVGIAIPNMIHLLVKFESNALTSQIRINLGSARSHGIFLQRTVTTCGLDNNNRCVSQNFSKMAVFVDSNKSRSIDEDDKIISITDLSYRGELNLRASFGRDFIEFNQAGNAKQSGSFIYCAKRYPHAARRITVSMTGRAYVGRDLDKDGIVEDTSGQPLAC